MKSPFDRPLSQLISSRYKVLYLLSSSLSLPLLLTLLLLTKIPSFYCLFRVFELPSQQQPKLQPRH
jgi:hypothetical protein